MREKAAEGRGLYRPEFEHDACGIGAVVDIQGRASHETVDDALKIVEKLEHRAGKDAEGKTATGWAYSPRSPTRFLPGRRRRRASPCPDGGTTAWACSSCLGTV